MVGRKVVVQSNMGYNVVTEEGGMIRFQEGADALFGEEEVADTVALAPLQPVPRLRRHPSEEVDFDFLVVDVHKWGRKQKVVRLRVVTRESVAQDVLRDVRVMVMVVGSEEEFRLLSDVEVTVVDRSDFVLYLC